MQRIGGGDEDFDLDLISKFGASAKCDFRTSAELNKFDQHEPGSDTLFKTDGVLGKQVASTRSLYEVYMN